MKKVGIVMGSKSDMPIVEKAINRLKEFGVPVQVRILSAHRTPEETAAFARTAREEGFGALIAAAGKAAALPGAIAACTTLPVIGLPIQGSFMDGLDSLLSMVQMPAGIPVATVAVNGSDNAALLAISILSVEDQELADKLDAYRVKMAQDVLKADAEAQA